MREHQAAIRVAAPAFDPEQLLGFSVDALIPDLRSTIEGAAGVQVRSVQLDTFQAGIEPRAVSGPGGEPVGFVTQWSDRTLEVRKEEGLNAVLHSALDGDLSQRVDVAGGTEFQSALAAGLNVRGKSLAIPVIADGVETEVQRNTLLEEGCNVIQGFLLGGPAPIEQFAQMTGRQPTTALERTGSWTLRQLRLHLGLSKS